YDDYLSGVSSSSGRQPTFLEKLVVKIAYHGERKDEDVVARLMTGRSNPSVCDIGCGPGLFLDRMRSAGATVVGIDPSSVSRSALNSKGIENYDGTAEGMSEA